jgi:hypothetical protein
MGTVTIRIDKLTNSFQASIVGDSRSTTQSGDTEAEAIGKLILTYANVFGIEIDRH